MQYLPAALIIAFFAVVIYSLYLGKKKQSEKGEENSDNEPLLIEGPLRLNNDPPDQQEKGQKQEQQKDKKRPRTKIISLKKK